MDSAWSISLPETDDIRLRNGEFDGDFCFRIYLRSNLEGIEQEFIFLVPAAETARFTRPQKMQLLNQAVEVVASFVGADLESNHDTRYILSAGRFIAIENHDRFTLQLPGTGMAEYPLDAAL